MNANVWKYLLLLNMMFPLYFMLQEPMHRLVPGIVSLAAIVGLHVAAIRMNGGGGLLFGLRFVLILLLGYVYHPMYLYLFFLLVDSFNGFRIRTIAIFTIVFTLNALGMMAVSGNWTNMQAWLNMLPPLFGGTIMPYVIHASARYRDMAERLQAATKQIERFAQQEERQRIARELHDTLGHTLSLIALKGEVTEKLVYRAPEKAAAEAREIRTTASAALKRMRELVSDMKIVRLSEEWEHARMLCAAAHVELRISEWKDHEGAVALTPLQESVIGMCVREALTNVVRHSDATACSIELSADENAIRCIVADNGSGSDTSFADCAGSGIIGMKQRLALLEGRLHVESEKGKGTRLTMEIPVIRRS